MRIACRLTCAALLMLGTWAAAAEGSEIVYVGADGNVWATDPDAASPRPVTQDASPDSPYRDPSLGDDGTVAVLRDRRLFFLALDGTPRSAPSVASNGGSATSSPPLGADLSPTGDAALYWYLYDPPQSAAPYARVTSLVPGFPGTECFLPTPCYAGYAVPKFIPGTRDFALIDASDGSLHVVTRSGDRGWLRFVDGTVFLSYDVSRTGFRLLAESAASFAEPAPSRLLYWENQLAPPDFPSEPRGCLLSDFASGAADLSWSPDGTAFTWAGQEGIYVSSAPVITDAGCELRPRLLVRGGTQPDWGEVSAAQPAPPEPSPPAAAVPGGGPSPAAHVIARATVQGLRVRPVTFRASAAGPSIAASGGARVSYRTSVATTARFTVERITRGIRRGDACVRPRRGARAPRCTRYVRVTGSWTHAAAKGADSYRFTGRVGGRRLRAGAYRMTVTAPDGVAPSNVARTLFAIR